MMDEICVIVPIYNVQNYLVQCVDSILNQTYTNFKLILVDDGSPDNCGIICDNYARKYEKVIAIHKKNGGLSDARNAGIEWCKQNLNSKWITFIDSDDWVHTKYLECLINAARSTDSKISISDGMITESHLVEDIGFEIAHFCSMKSEDAYAERYGSCMTAWGKLFSSELIESSMFPFGKIHEDAFTIYKLIFSVDHVALLDEPLYYYFHNIEGITHSSWKPARLDEIEAHENQLSFLKNSPYTKAYAREIDAFVHVLGSQINSIKTVSGYSDYLKNLKLKLKKTMPLYRKFCSRQIKKNEWLYEIAYPEFMTLYWIMQAVKRKIHVR